VISKSNAASPVWVAQAVTLADGRPAIVRMARRGCAFDTLWAVDTRGTMHLIYRRSGPQPPCTHNAPTQRTPTSPRKTAVRSS
jgi:hypothetical protein